MRANQILNIELEPIRTIQEINNEFYFCPTINFDRLKPKEKPAELRLISPGEDIKILDDFGIGVFLVKLTPSQCWAKKQKQKYYLRFLDLPQDKSAKIINKLPIDHCIEVDIANRKLRLVGPHISPEQNFTEWIYY